MQLIVALLMLAWTHADNGYALSDVFYVDGREVGFVEVYRVGYPYDTTAWYAYAECDLRDGTVSKVFPSGHDPERQRAEAKVWLERVCPAELSVLLDEKGTP
jgi:hypothetical protein